MTFTLSLFGTLLLLSGVIYFGGRKPNYNHWHNTISELGEAGSPIEKVVNYGLFLPVGLLLWLVAVLTNIKSVTGLAGCIGTGYVVAAFFPCDTGAPTSGSSRQQIHNLGGAVEYLGGAYWLRQVSLKSVVVSYEVFSIAAGCVVAGGLLLSISSLSIRGLIQRIVEVLLFGGLLVSILNN